MPERTLPGLGLTGFWDLGAPYKAGMDENLRRLSALVQAGAVSRTTALPASGTTGDIYIVPAGAASNANEIAMWDGPTGGQAWVYLVPLEGWEFYVRDTNVRVRFDGTAWIEAAGAGGSMTGAEIVAAIDTQLGSTVWQQGGGGGPQRFFRYWRWRFTAPGPNSNLTGVALAEIEGRVLLGGTDILLGGTPSASQESFGTVAANAFNNVLSDFWGAATAVTSDPQWVQYDLGAGNEAWLFEYTIRARSGGESVQMASAWVMEYSADGVVWNMADMRAGQASFGNGERRTYQTSMAQPGGGATCTGDRLGFARWSPIEVGDFTAENGGTPTQNGFDTDHWDIVTTGPQASAFAKHAVSGDFDKVIVTHLTRPNSGNAANGVFIGDSTTGQKTCVFLSEANDYFLCQHFSGTTYEANGPAIPPFLHPEKYETRAYWRIQRTGASVNVSVSFDGLDYLLLLTLTSTESGIVTLDEIGVYHESNSVGVGRVNRTRILGLDSGPQPEAVVSALPAGSTGVTDLNLAVSNGVYDANAALNAPAAGHYLVEVTALTPNWLTQEAWEFGTANAADGQRWRRYRQNNVWGAWLRVNDQISEVDARIGQVAPAAHTHTIANVSGLQAALDGKAASSHAHTLSQITDAGAFLGTAVEVTDWNDALDNGFYKGNDAANTPPGAPLLSGPEGVMYLGHVTRHGADWLTQEIWQISGSGTAAAWRYRRYRSAGVWTAWTRIYEQESEFDARVNSLRGAARLEKIERVADGAIYETTSTTPWAGATPALNVTMQDRSHSAVLHAAVSLDVMAPASSNAANMRAAIFQYDYAGLTWNSVGQARTFYVLNNQQDSRVMGAVSMIIPVVPGWSRVSDGLLAFRVNFFAQQPVIHARVNGWEALYMEHS